MLFLDLLSSTALAFERDRLVLDLDRFLDLDRLL